jgi:hypothetical protein
MRPQSSLEDDPAQALPPGARDKLVWLRDERDALHGAVQKANARCAPNLDATQELERRIYLLMNSAGDPKLRPTKDHPKVKELRDQHAALEAEGERLAEVREVRNAKWSAAASTVRMVEGYLNQLLDNGIDVSMHSGREPTARRGEFAPHAVERYREQRAQLRADLRKIQTAPRPSSWAKHRAREWVSELAQQGQVSPAALIEIGGRLELPKRMAEVHNSDPRNVVHAYVPDAVALLAWLFPEALTERLETMIDEVADDEHALTDTQRSIEIARITREVLQVERDEEFFVCAANGAVSRRDDVDVRALLDIDGPDPTDL